MKNANYFSLTEFTRHLSKQELGEVYKDKQLQAHGLELLARLNILRELVGQPIYVTSWYRCPEHNKEAGGSPKSQHLDGSAVDIKANNQSALFNCIQHMIKTGYDFGQIILYGSNRGHIIHLSLPTRQARNEILHS